MRPEDSGQMSAFSAQLSAISLRIHFLRGLNSVKDFRAVKVLANGHHLTLRVYKETQRFPKDELYGLTSQIRRAAFRYKPILLKAAEEVLILSSGSSCK